MTLAPLPYFHDGAPRGAAGGAPAAVVACSNLATITWNAAQSCAAENVYFGGGYICVVGHNTVNAYIIDITTPSSPVVIATITAPSAILQAALLTPTTIVFSVASPFGGYSTTVLYVYDVTTPSAPSLLATGTVPGTVQYNTDSNPWLACPNASTIVVGTDGNYGFATWNIIETFTWSGGVVTHVGEVGNANPNTPDMGKLIVLDANHVVGLNNATNIVVYDVSAPSTPTIQSDTSLSAYTFQFYGGVYLAASKTLVIACSPARLLFIDLTNYSAPVYLGTYTLTTTGPGNIAARGNIIYVSSDPFGTAPYGVVETVDLTVLASPVTLGTVAIPGQSASMIVPPAGPIGTLTLDGQLTMIVLC